MKTKKSFANFSKKVIKNLQTIKGGSAQKMKIIIIEDSADTDMTSW
jgi:hypothetical protein